jgi:hypothetical protein
VTIEDHSGSVSIDLEVPTAAAGDFRLIPIPGSTVKLKGLRASVDNVELTGHVLFDTAL